MRNRDYDRLVEDLRQLDDNLTQGGLEEMAIRFGLSQLPPGASGAVRNRKAQFALYSLRVELLRHLLGLPGFVNLPRFCGHEQRSLREIIRHAKNPQNL